MQRSPYTPPPAPPLGAPDDANPQPCGVTQICDIMQMNLDSLAQRCATESRRFYHSEPSNTRYGYELFRRAIVERNQDAWAFIHELYVPLVERWVRRSSAFSSTGESAEYFVSAAFIRFCSSLTAEKFANFPSLAGLLNYLQRCALGAIIDCVRAQPWGELLPEEAIPIRHTVQCAPDEEALARVSGAEFWRYVDTQLYGAAERKVIYLSFVFGMKPSEIYEKHADVFASVQEVYTTKRNALDRLSRNAELRRMLVGG
jgi:hypothetical protein